MVNVGGRSKGCSHCRRRRIKCDENRPICRRCQGSGLQCDGPRDTAFIEGTIVRSRRSQNPAIAWVRRDIEEQNRAVQTILQSTVPLKQNEHEVYICYTRKHLLPGGPLDVGLQDLQLADITTTSRKTTDSVKGPVFNQAMLSFAAVFFGAQHKQTRILTQGYAMHGAALKQLNFTLSDSSCYIRDEVIVSVIALAMLECLVPTGPKNYLKHMLGLERLLELRKPEYLAHCVRNMILFASVRARKPSILARPEWKKVLRVHCADQDMQEQDLCDALADCTVLLAECDKLMTLWAFDMEKAVPQRDKLERNAVALLTYLRTWKDAWDSDEQNAYYVELAPPSDSQSPPAQSVGDDSRRMSTVLRFGTGSAARMLMLHSTTLIHVLQILASLPLNSSEDRSEQTASLIPWQYTAREDDDIWECIANAEWAAAARLAALQAGQCLPDYLDHERALSDLQFASPVVQWAVSTSWKTLGENGTAEGRWMMGLLNERSNQAIARGMWDA
ncbi:uncharacterized protein K460DRAFT_370581 [Cucurbitaria berberidis CBS 394.84]|uniref:Zn(2)-C6 fungal-type domain-containing protein n=1 Tax=Cucurbitaria berberidis CBS 394.84 TaxID=1168544 RepID=A0A9P4GBS2_9PLEO|nr:uncharacterized protein K460DRAFT_370581 [Cucurbitaria berberidis CBS 394.84]KAF1842609.1 hypothetical protein K460DRAFT_370581 [Cucurbitaria berberidis CBS 394.84]